jgi:hypothetical protein
VFQILNIFFIGHHHKKMSINVFTPYTIFSLTLNGQNDFATVLRTCVFFVHRDIGGNPVAGPSLSDITCQIEPLGKDF